MRQCARHKIIILNVVRDKKIMRVEELLVGSIFNGLSSLPDSITLMRVVTQTKVLLKLVAAFWLGMTN